MVNAGSVNHRLSSGTTAPGFEAVRNQLDAYLLADSAYSAQLSVYWRGEAVIDLVGGPDLSDDSITGVFSVSKGVAAVTLSTLVQDGRLDLDTPVVDYWPEFGAHGKDRILVRELLSHQSGLVNVDGGLRPEELFDSRVGAAKIADARPLWRPGSAFGYHGLTVGLFIEELARRVTGRTIQDLYESTVRAPREIDFWLGLPASEEPRFRPLLPMAPTPRQQAEISDKPQSPDGLTAHMFNRVTREFDDTSEDISPNSRAARAAGFSSIAGVGSARGLAKLYASAIGAWGDPILTEATVDAVSEQQCWGVDRVLGAEMAFGIVFMRPVSRMEFGSYRAFGHDGAGGALAFADPLYGLGFGYIPMPMQYPGGADVKGVRLSQIVRQCIRQLT